MTKLFPKFTRTVDGITIAPRLRAWKQPELKLHNIPKKKSRELVAFLTPRVAELTNKPPELQFNIGDWFLYIHLKGKVRNKKKFVLRLRDVIADWLMQHK